MELSHISLRIGSCYYLIITYNNSFIFSDCSGTLIISDNVERIPDYMFFCAGISGSLVIPNSVIYMGNYAFKNCSDLTSIEIPNSVTSIGNYTFFGCSGLTSIEIPNSVTSFGDWAFSHCSGLTTIEIPNSVTSIGDRAFCYCSGLTSITILADNPPTLGSDVFYNVNKSISVFVPCGAVEAYQNASGWNEFTNMIGLCSGVVSVTVNPSEGGTVTGAGYYEGGAICTLTATANPGYTFINWIKDGVEVSNAETYSFIVVGDATYVANFAQGTTITFADANVKALCVTNWDTNGDGELSYAEAAAVSNLGEVFKNNSSITSFDELQHFIRLTSIGTNAFYNCRGLTSIEIPNSVTFIGYAAFYNCSSLISIEIPISVTNMEVNPFEGCSGLEQIIVEVGNTIYDSRDNCNAIIKSSTNELISGCKNTVIPISVTSIGSSAFYGCSGLTAIETPDSVTTIGDFAFYYCAGLSSVTIGNSVASIDGWAFSQCTGLTSMTVLADNPPILGNYAFGSVNKSIPVYVPCSVVEVYQNASGWNEFTNMIGLCSGEVSVTVNPSEGGTVTGAGYYNGGDMCVLTATPNPGFRFGNWIKNGEIVSTDTVLSFYDYPTSVVANFCLDGFIVFADVNVKALCVVNWDTNGDGELSYVEAAAVTSLGNVFRNNSLISSFNELQYFIGLTSIDNFAFRYCTGLTSIEIPNSVTSIGFSAFSDCTGLTSIEIPNSVTSIGQDAFIRCRGLTSLIVFADNPPTLGNYVFSGVNKSIPVYVPCSAVEAYQNASGWNEFTNMIGLCSGEVAVTVNPPEGGTVTGAGYYEGGATCTLTATPNEGYFFMNWMENGIVVSYDATYSFAVTSDRDLVANFAEEGSICYLVFDLYDSFGDGWTDNFLVIDYGDGNSEQLTIEDGWSVSYSRIVATGSHVTLTWIMGWFTEECSFTVHYMDGDTIYEDSNIGSNFEYSFDVDCSGGNVTQAIALSQGWNWFSTNVEITLDDLKTALVDAVPGTSITIKSKTQNTAYNPGTTQWRGSLNSLDVSQMYMVYVSAGCEITLTGSPVNPAEHPITINNGANWMAFPLSESMSVSNAFTGFAVDGDVIKDKTSNASYINGQWRGTLNTLEPGKGYMYISNSQETRTFTFPIGNK